MCDPFTIAGIALTAGSYAANGIAASKAARARDDALAAERVRQGALDQEAQALNVQSQDRYQNFDQQQEQQGQQLGDYFASQSTAEPTAAAALPTTTSDITVREENKQRTASKDFTNKQGQALGNLRAFGDLLGSIGREQAQDASLIGQIGGFKRGSSNVVPLELDAASHKGDSLKLFGDILGGLGSVGVSYGMSGGNPFGAAASGPMNLGAMTKAAPKAAGWASGAATPLRLGALY